MNSFVVRRARVAEVDAAWKLAHSIPTAAHWSREDFAAGCDSADLGDTQAKALFVACSPERPGEIAGFAAFSIILGLGGGECELENMAVAEPWRRHGLALRLLRSGVLWCRARRFAATPYPELRLEVRASNQEAIAFYERAGFAVTGRRPFYYKEPNEDAILMSRMLTVHCLRHRPDEYDAFK